MALSSSPQSMISPRTRKLRPAGPNPVPDTTDYELGLSVGSPSLTPAPAPSEIKLETPARKQYLDAATAQLFHHRLRLCCLIAVVPMAFFFLCGITSFIELFGHATLGWSGVILAGVVLTALATTAGGMFRFGPFPESSLRVLEVAIFGQLSLFFAYWQFSILTASPEAGFDSIRHVQSFVLAASGMSHFNWLLLIVFHAVLVPNSIARGVGITAVMCIAALAIDTMAAAIHEPITRNAGVLFSIGGTILAAGAGLAIFGTAKTAALQREVESARAAVRQMGQYRLRRKLGSGGMGEVYLAEHRLLKRPCALKRIHAKYLNNPEQLKRFEREVQATAQLRHPNTVEIYDYGVAEDGTFYYVMEYLPGLSLEDLVGRHGPQPPERVIHLLRQVCGALREAHKYGLVHRDIKPSNILVFAEGSPHDQVKLVDFGLVHSLLWESDADAKITREGLIVGTPEYMSPEQASGIAIDARSDLFSLGSVMYYLLTGREAFHRDNPMKTLMSVVTDPLPRLSDSNPFAPKELAIVLSKCTAKDPDDRYSTAAELENALAECPGAGGWSEARAGEWWTLHPDARPGTGTDLNTMAMPDED